MLSSLHHYLWGQPQLNLDFINKRPALEKGFHSDFKALQDRHWATISSLKQSSLQKQVWNLAW